MKSKKKIRRPAGERAFVTSSMLSERNVDEDVESIAEQFIAGATSAEDMAEDFRNEFVEEELGGPFQLFNVRFFSDTALRPL